MRTAIVALIVLVRFGPDIVYGAQRSLRQSDSPTLHDGDEVDREPARRRRRDPPITAMNEVDPAAGQQSLAPTRDRLTLRLP